MQNHETNLSLITLDHIIHLMKLYLNICLNFSIFIFRTLKYSKYFDEKKKKYI